MSIENTFRKNDGWKALIVRPLRSHRQRLLNLLGAVGSGHTLIRASLAEPFCRVVPRDGLRLQAKEAFADFSWRNPQGIDARDLADDLAQMLADARRWEPVGFTADRSG